MGGNASADRRLNNADETEDDDRELRTNEAGSSVTSLAAAAGAVAGAAMLAYGVVSLLSASGASSERETMEVPQRNDQISDSENIHWQPPMQGFVKLNTDGSSKGNPHISGAGGLLRDSAGNWIVGFKSHLGICPIIDAELHAVRLGLMMAWDEGYRRIVCEMDAKRALMLINSADVLGHPLEELIQDIWELRDRNWECSFQTTLREGNFCADILAKLGRSMDNDYELLRTPPPEVVKALQADAKGNAYPRGFTLKMEKNYSK